MGFPCEVWIDRQLLMRISTVNKTLLAVKNKAVVWRYWSILRLSLLLFFIASIITLIFIGCEPRSITRTTPQMDIESDYWVRVLLLDDVEEIYVETLANLSF